MADPPQPVTPPAFDHVVAIDWSGARGEHHRGIALAIASTRGGPLRLVPPPHPKGWSRADILDWLLTEAPTGTLAGFDLGLSLPFADAGAFFPGWPESSAPPAPATARDLWALVDTICADEPHLGATRFADHIHASRHFRRPADRAGLGRRGDLYHLPDAADRRGRLRVTEIAQAKAGLSPTSNFNLVGASQVGKSSLSGMRLLHRLPADVPVWPIDPLPLNATPPRLMVCEIYTTIAAIAGGRRAGASKIKDTGALALALAHIEGRTLANLPPSEPITDHDADALITAAWLRAHAHRAELWNPRGLTRDIALTEGWTFGVA